MNKENQLDLERLRARLREKPRTKVGQVRQAWPYIKELFEAGHSLKDVCAWLNEIGMEIGYARLSHYVGRLRRAEESRFSAPPAPEAADPAMSPKPEPPVVPSPVKDGEPSRPLANLLERETKRPGFHFNSDLDPKKLI